MTICICTVFFSACVEDMSLPLVEEQKASATLIKPESYTLVWSEEFDSGSSPNTDRWTYDLGSQLIGGTVWGNDEKQFYTSDEENVYVADGKLVIQAKYETTAGAPSGVIATSARLKTDTSDYWQAVGSEPYGFYEVRAKIPCIRGAWPAIWMLGKDGVWPDRGEIDITEWFGRYSDQYTVTSAVHNGAFSGGDLGNAPSGNPQTAQQRLNDLCTAYHNFQLHWTSSSLVIGVDNVPTLTYRKTSSSNAQWPFDQPAFLLLNVAVGGNLGGSVNPSDISKMTMYVDYVRVWQ